MALNLMTGATGPGVLDPEEERRGILEESLRTDRDRLALRRRDRIREFALDQDYVPDAETKARMSRLVHSTDVSGLSQEGRVLELEAMPAEYMREGPGKPWRTRPADRPGGTVHVSGAPGDTVQGTLDYLEAGRREQESQRTDLELFDSVQRQINQAQHRARQKQAATAAGKMARVKAFKAMGRVGQTMDVAGLDAVEKLVNQTAGMTAEEFDSGMAVLSAMPKGQLSRGEKNLLFEYKQKVARGAQRVTAAVAKNPNMSVGEWNNTVAEAFDDPVIAEKGAALVAQIRPKGLVTEETMERANRPMFSKWLKEELDYSDAMAEDVVKSIHRNPESAAKYEQFLEERPVGSFYIGDGGNVKEYRPTKYEAEDVVRRATSVRNVTRKGYRPSKADSAGRSILINAGMSERDVDYLIDYDGAQGEAGEAGVPFREMALKPGTGALRLKSGGLPSLVTHGESLYDQGASYEDAVRQTVAWGQEQGHIDGAVEQVGEYRFLRSRITEGIAARKQGKLEDAQSHIAASDTEALRQVANALTDVVGGKIQPDPTAFPGDVDKNALLYEYNLISADDTVQHDNLDNAVQRRLLAVAKGAGLGPDTLGGKLLTQYLRSVPSEEWPEFLRVAHQKVTQDFMAPIIAHEVDRKKAEREYAREREITWKRYADGTVKRTSSSWMHEDSLVKVEAPAGESGRAMWVANPLVGDFANRIRQLEGGLNVQMMQRLEASAVDNVYGADADSFFRAFAGMMKPQYARIAIDLPKLRGALVQVGLKDLLKHDFTTPHMQMDLHYGKAKDAITLMSWFSSDPATKAYVERRSGDLRRGLTGLEHPVAWEEMSTVAGKSKRERGKKDGKSLEQLAKGTPVEHMADALGHTLVSELYADGKHMAAFELAYIKTVDKRMRKIGEVSELATVSLGEALSQLEGMELLLNDISIGKIAGLAAAEDQRGMRYLKDAIDRSTFEQFEAFAEAFGAYEAHFSQLKGQVGALTGDLGIDKDYAESLSLDAAAGLSSFAQLAEITKRIRKEIGGELVAAEDQRGMQFHPGIPSVHYRPRKTTERARELRASRELAKDQRGMRLHPGIPTVHYLPRKTGFETERARE